MKKRYVCKRTRMLSALKKLGFEPYDYTVDFNNPKYNVYFFDLETPGLKEAIDNYFKEINSFKQEEHKKSKVLEENNVLKVNNDLFEKGLTANEIFILAKVQQFTENKCECYMTNQQFADWLNISKPTVDNALKNLENLGLIDRDTCLVSNLGQTTRQRVIRLCENKSIKSGKKEFTGHSF